MATKTLEIAIVGTNKSATKAFKEVDDAAGTTEGKLRQLGDKIGPAVATAAAATVAAVGLAMKGAFDAAQESAKISRETERVITSTGASAWTTADQVSGLSRSISELTGADDELIQSGSNLLLTFTNIQNKMGAGNDIFDQATALALDMSVALGTDMSSASIQLGKALNDPVRGITALSRAGVSFTADQKEQIRTLVETGDVLGAQKIILGELSKEFGGAAEAAATPVDKLRTKLGNLQEDVGAALTPAFSRAADVLSAVTDAFIALPGPVKAVVEILGVGGVAGIGAVAVVSKLASVFSDTLGPVISFARGLFQDLALKAGVLAEKLMGSADAGMKVAEGMAGAVGPALTGVGIALAAATVAMIGFTIYQQQQAQDAAEAAKGQEAYAKALALTTGTVEDNVAQTTAQLFMEKRIAGAVLEHGMNLEVLGRSISETGDSWDSYRDKYNRITQDTGPLIDALRRASAEGDAAATEIIKFYDANQLSDNAVKDLVFTLDDLQDQYQGGVADGEKQKAIFDGIAGASHNATTAIQQQVSSLKDLADELRAQTDPYFAAFRSQQQLNDALATYDKTSKDSTKTDAEKKAAWVAAASAAAAYKGDLVDLNIASKDAGATTDAFRNQMVGLAKYGLDLMGDSAQGAMGDLSNLGGVADAVDAKEVNIPVTADTEPAKAKLRELSHRIVDQLRGTGGFMGGLYNTFADALEQHYRNIGLYAKGGMVGDGMFMVGEEGPELGVKSGSSVRIFSNPDSKRMVSSSLMGGGSSMGGGDVNVYVNRPEASAYDIGRELRWQLAVTR